MSVLRRASILWSQLFRMSLVLSCIEIVCVLLKFTLVKSASSKVIVSPDHFFYSFTRSFGCLFVLFFFFFDFFFVSFLCLTIDFKLKSKHNKMKTRWNGIAKINTIRFSLQEHGIFKCFTRASKCWKLQSSYINWTIFDYSICQCDENRSIILHSLAWKAIKLIVFFLYFLYPMNRLHLIGKCCFACKYASTQ